MSLTISIGSHVEFTVSGRDQAFTLVAPNDASPTDGRLSAEAPVGRALLGRQAGEVVEVRTPRGMQRLAVRTVS